MRFVSLCIVVVVAAPGWAADAPGVDFFESKVRPVLAEHCYSCHGAKKQQAGLRLDTADGLKKGTEEGPVVVPGDPEKSRLVAAVKRVGDYPMPPSKPLPADAVAALSEWVKAGAPVPTEVSLQAKRPTASKDHWAFKPVADPDVPVTGFDSDNPIDQFVAAGLEAKGLAISPKADKRTLIRRAYFDLIGLPPTADEIEAFLRDTAPDAFARIIDHLLASPHYGERWGRHWLDVARFADSKGYVFTEDRSYPYAYTYRDYVIRSFNEDKPYDQFVVDQLAADKLPAGKDNKPLAGLGFLTVGRRFSNNTHDIIDDRIDVVSRGLMGLTVSCARCHDHKFDPIPTADYYSLYGVFASTTEPAAGGAPLIDPAGMAGEAKAFEDRAVAMKKKADDFAAGMYAAHLARFRTADAVTNYLLAARDARDKTAMEVEKLATERKLEPILIGKWQEYLAAPARKTDPVFAPWLAVADLPAKGFKKAGPAALAEILKPGGKVAVNPDVVDALRSAEPDSLQEVAEVYGKLLADAAQPAPKDAAPDPARDQLAKVLAAGGGGPTDLEVLLADKFVPITIKRQFRALRNAADRYRTDSPDAPPRAMAVADAATPTEPVVFLRGNPNNPGPKVPRQFLQVVAGADRKPFADGSGRLELAKAIASPTNPLTARVMVNRVWLHHFGAGLVRTPSDFGLRSDPPTHPELLDWLATRLVEDGWSVKKLHRRIMLSATYQQSSDVSADMARLDPENRLIGRQTRQRLEYEPLRDSMLAAAGRLDPTVYGRSVNLLAAPFPTRRAIYATIDRQNLPGTFRAFDMASPDAHTPQRFVTTVPQQALYLLNNAFVAEQAKAVAARPDVAGAADPEAKVRALFRAVLSRDPTATEIEDVAGFVYLSDGDAAEGQLGPWELAAQALLVSNEFAFVD